MTDALETHPAPYSVGVTFGGDCAIFNLAGGRVTVCDNREIAQSIASSLNELTTLREENERLREALKLWCRPS